MKSLTEADWPAIESFREQVNALQTSSTLVAAAQSLCELFAQTFASIVLARVFVVLPLGELPAPEQAFARRLLDDPRAATDSTRVLCLLGTSGKQENWCHRERSAGHLAIPLLNAATVAGAPMIAKLLSDLNIDLRALDDGRPIVTRQMMGGKNGVFYVADAEASRDSLGRHIVPATEFVLTNRIATVFGMGGAYVDGTLAVVVLFCNERLERSVVDRYASLVSSFKMATAATLEARRVF